MNPEIFAVRDQLASHELLAGLDITKFPSRVEIRLKNQDENKLTVEGGCTFLESNGTVSAHLTLTSANIAGTGSVKSLDKLLTPQDDEDMRRQIVTELAAAIGNWFAMPTHQAARK